MVWSVHVSKSSHPRIDRTLSVRRIIMSCFCPDESPKFGIVLRSSNRRSRDRRNVITLFKKANQTQPLHNSTLKMKQFFSISYQNVFLAHFRGLWFGLSKFQNLTVHVSIVRCQYEELSVHKKKNCPCTCPLKHTLSVRITVREHALSKEAAQARKDSCLSCLSKSAPTTIL